MAVEEDDGGAEIPEWVVTFGDMMSLLLTFFIMLVSMSEIKQEEKFQALVQSLEKQFGHQSTLLSMAPGPAKPRNSLMAKLATMGRAKRLDIMRGGNKSKAPVGDEPDPTLARAGVPIGEGIVIYFGEGLAPISETNQRNLREFAVGIVGKPQKIEIRGHTSMVPAVRSSNGQFRDNWTLAFERCMNTREFLVAECGIDERRLRLAVAGRNEPVAIDEKLAATKRSRNPRVEVIVLDEVVSDTEGSAEEQRSRVQPVGSAPTNPADEPSPN